MMYFTIFQPPILHKSAKIKIHVKPKQLYFTLKSMSTNFKISLKEDLTN